jgi:SpoVK/Ycf46/Vps4 family AAA+-type ATPase
MEVDEKPTEEYSDIGGADEQIQELIEAVVLPMTHKDMFDAIGIRPPKGVLLHGPPGTGMLLSFLFVAFLSMLQNRTRHSRVSFCTFQHLLFQGKRYSLELVQIKQMLFS